MKVSRVLLRFVVFAIAFYGLSFVPLASAVAGFFGLAAGIVLGYVLGIMALRKMQRDRPVRYVRNSYAVLEVRNGKATVHVANCQIDTGFPCSCNIETESQTTVTQRTRSGAWIQ